MTDLTQFARLGIRTESDLLLHLPLRYEDETRITEIGQVRPGETVQVAFRVIRDLMQTDGTLPEDWDKLVRKLTE